MENLIDSYSFLDSDSDSYSTTSTISSGVFDRDTIKVPIPYRSRVGEFLGQGDQSCGEGNRRESEDQEKMLGWNCCWRSNYNYDQVRFHEPRHFLLPAPMPKWPEGEGFAKGIISIGELELVQITDFQSIWCAAISGDKSKGATFYKPIGVPDGFFCLGHYGQPNDQLLHGFVIVAREVPHFESSRSCQECEEVIQPALSKPLDYKLIWRSNNCVEDGGGCGCFWYPCPPEGYKSLGYVVTSKCEKPSLEEVRCVRSDLTDTCETNTLIFDTESMFPGPLYVWSTRPSLRGMWEKGLSVGTFFCSSSDSPEFIVVIACLKNLNLSLEAMPNMDQIHEIIKQYGPTIFFHSEEVYLPSSVSWFFKNGSLLYREGNTLGVPIDSKGSNLPSGGQNDGKFWIDLPNDDKRNYVMRGDLETAELYVHIKPALGGTFTDIAMWLFCPFNGPATLKLGLLNVALSKIGEHVGDWEHFTLRVSNFTGELWSIYFSQHSGGEWVDVCNLEYIDGNKAIVYSSKSGHASFPHPGNYLQGSAKLGIGIRNDAERSDIYLDSSIKYQIIAAEYLGDSVTEPCWLQYMREWGPTIVYDSKTDLDKIVSHLPIIIRLSVENIIDKLPMELYGEEGPTGPKEKDMWEGDERS